jgi:hypothetical protein
MACGAIPESSAVPNAEALVARRPGKRQPGLVDISEKQYQIPAGLARNCRFFLISARALNQGHSPLFGNAEPSHQPYHTCLRGYHRAMATANRMLL